MVAAELDSAELAKLTVAEMLKRNILINCTSDMVLRFRPSSCNAPTWTLQLQRWMKFSLNMRASPAQRTRPTPKEV